MSRQFKTRLAKLESAQQPHTKLGEVLIWSPENAAANRRRLAEIEARGETSELPLINIYGVAPRKR